MTKKTIELNGNGQNWPEQLFSFLIVLILLSGCYFPSSTTAPDTSAIENVSDFATILVDIQFQLELAEPISESEGVVLEILDDVSGLLNNIQRYELEKLSDQIYYTIISVPSGSVIKYRYGKITDSFFPEVTPDGKPIAYRLYYAPNHAIVKDVLQAWQGEADSRPTGWLTGRLLDYETNQPIPDILVGAGGRRTFTDANGKYLLEGLGEGIHNALFYAMDGKYRPYQQNALIKAGMQTPGDVKLVPLPEVNVTFHVTPPKDAMGAQIYLAGNILQLGNTFSDLHGSMSIKPKRMPMLKQNTDGILSVSLQLYAETDLRYIFTLGDGYWNVEQKESGGSHIQQLIVPHRDVTLNHRIETWRSTGIEPVTFSVKIPRESSPRDTKYIQFYNSAAELWTEPIPLWPLGGGNHLYILFSPLDSNQPIRYQFCRNADCVHTTDAGSSSFEREVKPSVTAQTIDLTLDKWLNWYAIEKNESVLEAYIPTKSAQYKTMIELSPRMDPSWLEYAPKGINQLEQIGSETVIFAPQWTVASNSPYLRPEIGSTPYYYELMELLNSTATQGFDIALFPQLGPLDTMESWWNSGLHTDAWWEIFFSSYRDFMLNYTKIAQEANASYLIMGGKAFLPAFDGGIFPDGSDSYIPINSDDQWLELINDINNSFDGELIWATNAHVERDPLPNFIDLFDEIYISVDSPLAFGDHPSFEMIQSGFTHLIDSQIYEVYRTTQKPITLALAYPSVETAASGCALLNEACFNDGIFYTDELTPYALDLEEQALIYNAIFPIIASRDWITATSIRGYDPTVIVYDGSSSIAGKPSFDVIQYWFTNMKP